MYSLARCHILILNKVSPNKQFIFCLYCKACNPQKMVLNSFRDHLSNPGLGYKKASPPQFVCKYPRIQGQSKFHIQGHR